MKMTPECIPCLLKRVIFECSLVDPTRTSEAVREACEILGKEYRDGVYSIGPATLVHENTYRILGTGDPYADLKRRSNEVAILLLPEAEEMIDGSRDRLEAAMLCSIAGNVLDFGIDDSIDKPENLRREFYRLCDEGIHVNHMGRMKEYLSEADERGSEVLYFTDNCGEIVFDKLFCREIKREYPGLRLVLVVKGQPVLSDATMEDAVSLNMEEVTDDIINTESFGVGVVFERIPSSLRERIERSSFIIAKGMGNFEAFSEKRFGKVAYLLRTKCDTVADALGYARNRNLAVIRDQLQD